MSDLLYLSMFLSCLLLFLSLFVYLAKIQSMKNAVPKNDKKRRKQLTEEIAKLEADLNQKHEEEFQQLQSAANKDVRTSFLSNFSFIIIFKLYFI